MFCYILNIKLTSQSLSNFTKLRMSNNLEKTGNVKERPGKGQEVWGKVKVRELFKVSNCRPNVLHSNSLFQLLRMPEFRQNSSETEKISQGGHGIF